MPVVWPNRPCKQFVSNDAGASTVCYSSRSATAVANDKPTIGSAPCPSSANGSAFRSKGSLKRLETDLFAVARTAGRRTGKRPSWHRRGCPSPDEEEGERWSREVVVNSRGRSAIHGDCVGRNCRKSAHFDGHQSKTCGPILRASDSVLMFWARLARPNVFNVCR
jgi:hypothetical protein